MPYETVYILVKVLYSILNIIAFEIMISDRSSFCLSLTDEEFEMSTLAPIARGSELEYFFASDARLIFFPAY